MAGTGLDPLGDHGDAFGGDAGQGPYVVARVAGGHDDALGVACRPAHAGVQDGAITGAEPLRVAHEGEVVDGHDPRPIGGRRHGVGRVDDLGPDLPGELRQLGKQTPQVRGAAQPDGRVPAWAGAGRCQGDGLGTPDVVEAVQQAADVGLVARLVAAEHVAVDQGAHACGAWRRRREGLGHGQSIPRKHGRRRVAAPSPAGRPRRALPAGRLRAAPTVPYHDTRSPGARGPPGRRIAPRADRRAQAPASRRQPTDRKSRVRASQFLLPTVKEDPAGAEAASHKLMVRAGLIRQLAAGIYVFLPAGWRVMRKIEAVIREEMESIGCQEMLYPVLNPAEIWQQSGRWQAIGDELFRLKDRKGTDMVLAMTHEEVVTWLAAREIHSYKQLPQLWFHIQTKERDEARPKSGLLRVREFIMKDSYSLDTDFEALQRSYDKHSAAYDRIFARCGVSVRRVLSDPGMMGGNIAHEYMAPSEAGEDEIVFCPKCGYAANVELAVAGPEPAAGGERRRGAWGRGSARDPHARPAHDRRRRRLPRHRPARAHEDAGGRQ